MADDKSKDYNLDQNQETRQEIEHPGEDIEDSNQDVEGKTDLLTEILEYGKLILTVIVLALLITNFVVQRNTVNGISMVPTLHDGDELIVEKVSRYFGKIDRFDIITVDTDGLDPKPNLLIKRVIGLPGEKVEIKDGQVYINDQVLAEPYLAEGTITHALRDEYAQVTLGEGEYYCIGDNRNNSNDSRSFGPVPHSHILGKLLLRFYPFSDFGVPK